MTDEVIIRCQKHQRLVYGVSPRTPTPNTPLKPIKNLGGLGKIWGGGAVPPGPSLKPPLF